MEVFWYTGLKVWRIKGGGIEVFDWTNMFGNIMTCIVFGAAQCGKLFKNPTSSSLFFCCLKLETPVRL